MTELKTYLKFASPAEAKTKLEAEGFVMSQYNDIATHPNGMATLFYIPDYTKPSVQVVDGGSMTTYPTLIAGYHCNLYDMPCPASLVSYQVPTPATPYNVKA